MKLNEYIVIRKKAIVKKQIIANIRNMKNILKARGFKEPANQELPTCAIDKHAPLATWT
jgi:hypothetical protein